MMDQACSRLSLVNGLFQGVQNEASVGSDPFPANFVKRFRDSDELSGNSCDVNLDE